MEGKTDEWQLHCLTIAGYLEDFFQREDLWKDKKHQEGKEISSKRLLVLMRNIIDISRTYIAGEYFLIIKKS